MRTTRRTALLGLAAGLLAGCGSGPRSAPTSPAPPVPALRPVPNPRFDAWVAAFRPRAEARGISRGTLDLAFRDVGFLAEVVERDRNQTEPGR